MNYPLKINLWDTIHLVYGSEAVTTVEIAAAMHQVRYFNEKATMMSDDFRLTWQTQNDERLKKHKENSHCHILILPSSCFIRQFFMGEMV